MACAHSFYFRKHLLPSSFPLSCAQPVPLKKNKKQKNGLSCYSFCDQLPPVTPMLMWNINSLGAQTETHHFVEIHYLSSCLWVRTSPVSSDLRAFFKVVRRDIIVPAAIKKHMCLLFFFSFFLKASDKRHQMCVLNSVVFFFFSLERVSVCCVQLRCGRAKSVSQGVRRRWEPAGLIEAVNGLSETIILPDTARGEALHHWIESDEKALIRK